MTRVASLTKRFAASLILAVIVLAGLLAFGDFHQIGNALRHIHAAWIPLIFLLAFCNYLIRFLRWSFYLRRSDIVLPFGKSWTVFFSGLAMSITPGKLGELVKAYFVRSLNDTPMRKTLAVVFGERFTDLLSVILLAGIGAISFHYGGRAVWVALLLVFVLLSVLMIRRVAYGLFSILDRMPVFKRFSHIVRETYENAFQLVQPGPLIVAILIGSAAWFCECSAFFLTAHALGQTLSLGAATFIYAFATLIGALTFLPGGLGTTEGSLAGLLVLRGVPKDAATAATLVIRIATLWFAVAVGLIFFLPNRKLLTQANES